MEQYFNVDTYEYTKSSSYTNEHRKKKIKQIDIRTGQTLAIFNSLIEAEYKTGIRHQGIIGTAKGRYHSSGGFKWEYVN